MTTRRAALAVLFTLAAPVAAASPAAPAPPARAAAVPDDSTKADPLAWARAVVAARRAVAAAEAEPEPGRQRALAADAFAAAQALGDAASVRPLALRAQAVYEAHHGPVAGPLSPADFAALRGPALADLGSNFAVPIVDPAALAAARAARAAAAAEAERAAGPDWLYYPATAAAAVDRERAIATRMARTARRNRRLMRDLGQMLRRRGVPEDIRYLAVVESGLNANAESWAGARGLWQFMPETAADYGLDSLTVADPVASTNAAARYLGWLARRFDGDWHLALAAYNGGVGRVEAIARAYRRETGRTATFWDIAADLPRETQRYVPRFVALAEAMGARG
ncbi:lytic transglycosylase domain-containing protein [Rubrivirga sp. IMCC45206]|uniref:lytic transglycosylase domain-containing protein n=1 Tax=Rubrivirga sp. IMCC45206 TaxID=3391614 RepID=UPI00399006F0